MTRLRQRNATQLQSSRKKSENWLRMHRERSTERCRASVACSARLDSRPSRTCRRTKASSTSCVELTAKGAHRGRKSPSATQTNKRQRLAQTARCAKGTKSKLESPRVQRPRFDRQKNNAHCIVLSSLQLIMQYLLGMKTKQSKQAEDTICQSVWYCISVERLSDRHVEYLLNRRKKTLARASSAAAER